MKLKETVTPAKLEWTAPTVEVYNLDDVSNGLSPGNDGAGTSSHS